MNESIVVFSHGFGVDKTDRGLFTDILAQLPDVTGVMFDFNQLGKDGDMTVRPLSEQAEALETVIKTVKEQNQPVSLVCHSQGCVVAGLVKPRGLEEIILLNPPVELSVEHLVKTFGDREGTEIDPEGESKLARADGSTTTVPKAYWDELASVRPVELYNKLSETNQVTLIVANQDHVLEGQHPKGLSEKAELIHLEGDHNFSDPRDRVILLQTVARILA